MSERDDARARYLAPAPAEEAAAREARHQVLIDLLGAYVDGELPAESTSQVEAHLVGCARCRREVAVQATLRDRLAAEPVAAATPALRERIRAATLRPPLHASPDLPARSRVAAPTGPPPRSATRRRLVSRWLAPAVMLLAGLGVALVSRPADHPGLLGAAEERVVVPLGTPAGTVPLLADAVADYGRTAASALPGRARDLAAVRAAVGFPVEPLPHPELRLLGAWTTTLVGEPAAVLAYRHDDGVVLQYVVADDVYFRDPALRAAAARRTPFAAREAGVTVVGWTQAATGSVLVASEDATALAALRQGATTR